jgi:hypothetical protein
MLPPRQAMTPSVRSGPSFWRAKMSRPGCVITGRGWIGPIAAARASLRIFCKLSVDLSPLIRVDLISGLPSYELHDASPAQLGALEIRETIRQNGRKVTRTVQIQPRARAQELGAVIRHFGLHEPDHTGGVDSLQALLLDIGRRGSTMPIATAQEAEA